MNVINVNLWFFSNESLSDSYKVGMEKIDEFLNPKENKMVINNILIEEDKQQIKQNSIEKYNSLCQKLKSKEKHNNMSDSNFDESDMSEISVEDKIDYSSFVKHFYESKNNLIF